MTNKHYKGNETIKRLVTCRFRYSQHRIAGLYPIWSRIHTKRISTKQQRLPFFVANAALFLGEYFYSTIIHVRKIGFLQVTKRTLYLAAATTFCFFTFLRLLGHGG